MKLDDKTEQIKPAETRDKNPGTDGHAAVGMYLGRREASLVWICGVCNESQPI